MCSRAERRLAVVERLEEPVAGDHRADGRVAGRQTLCAGDDVGYIAEVVAGEHRADPAVRADHLVGHQQHVVLVADLADALEIPWRRREAAARVLHGFEEDRGDGVGTLELDRLGDAVGAVPTERLCRVEARRRPVEVGVGRAETTRGQRTERRLERGQAGDREGALGCAVVGDRARNHLVLTGFTGELEVVFGQFPRRLDSLAAAGGEKHAIEIARCIAGDCSDSSIADGVA